MEKKWDTLIPADLKRLFLSGTYMSRWSQNGKMHSDWFNGIEILQGE